MIPAKVLITGASGLIGSRLTDYLIAEGYEVAYLGRSVSKGKPVGQFVWDIERGILEHGTLDRVEAIVHLAGAGLADKRWSAARKREITGSRVRTTRLLFEQLARQPHQVKVFVSASGVNYYGLESPDVEFTEEAPPGNDFLARVVQEWEAEVDRVASLGIRVVKLRAGMVLARRDGALERLVRPVAWNVGAYLGRGTQYVPWVHIDDWCACCRFVLENRVSGAFNLVAPGVATNKELTDAIARQLNKKIRLPSIPPFVLHAILGGLAHYVLHGNKVSPEKLRKQGFSFRFERLDEALNDLLN